MARKNGYVARRPRHLAAATVGVRVVVERVAPSQSEPVEVELLDLSRQGIRVRAAVPISVGETVTLRLHDENSGLGLTRRCAVRWRHPDRPGTWVIGCEFFERVEWETLGELFLNDVLSTDPPSSGAAGAPPVSADRGASEASAEPV